jgi:flavin reductase (DIM6/NTAB) family NADH-FMN oxidoreductase RutF
VINDTAAFEALVGELDYLMNAVTAASDDDADADGCLVRLATQCSISPQRFVACLSKQSRTTRLAAQATSFVVQVLHETDRDLAERFANPHQRRERQARRSRLDPRPRWSTRPERR